MANFNKVILAGNLTRDPELRYTPKGTAVARLTIAVNRTWKSETGESKEETTFVDVDAFGRQAETLGQYMKKGRPILIEGRLKYDQWEDKQTGQKRSKLGVVMDGFQFLGSGPGGGGTGGGRSAESSDFGNPPARSNQAAAPSTPESDAPMPEEDDVPF